MPDDEIRNEDAEKLRQVRQMQENIRASYEAAGIPMEAPETVLSRMQDPRMEALHQRAKEFFRRDMEIMDRFTEDYPIPDAPFSRIYYYYMRRENTPEAVDYNLKFLAGLRTPEGKRQFANMIVRDIMSADPAILYPGSLDKAVENYLDNPTLMRTLFVTTDLLEALTVNAADSNGFSLLLDEPLRTAFRERKLVVEPAQSLENQARLLARDDWALHLRTDLTDEQMQTWAACRIANTVQNNDRYATGTRRDKRGQVYDELGDWAIQQDTFRREQTNGRRMLAEDVFPDAVSMELDGKTVTKGSLLYMDPAKAVQAVKRQVPQERMDALHNQLRALPAEIYVPYEQPVEGEPFRQDMQDLHELLDSVNHGMFISSGNFNRVLRQTEDMAKGKGVQTPEEVKAALERLDELCQTYLTDKLGPNPENARLSELAQTRVNAIRAVQTEVRKHLDVFAQREKHAAICQKNYERQHPETYAAMKPILDTIDAKMAAAGEASEIAPQVSAAVNAKQMAENMKDPKRMELHERAKKVVAPRASKPQVVRANTKTNPEVPFNYGVNRIFVHYLDPRTTPEAAEFNRRMMHSLSTAKNQQRMMNRYVKECMDPANNKALVGSTLEDMLTAYETDPSIGEKLFAMADSERVVKRIGEPLVSLFNDRLTMATGSSCIEMGARFLAGPAVFTAPAGTDLGSPFFNQLQELTSIAPNALPGLDAAVSFLGMSTSESGKKLEAQGVLDNRHYFTDDKGKHLTYQQAIQRMDSDKPVQVHEHSQETIRKAEKLLEDLPTDMEISPAQEKLLETVQTMQQTLAEKQEASPIMNAAAKEARGGLMLAYFFSESDLNQPYVVENASTYYKQMAALALHTYMDAHGRHAGTPTNLETAFNKEPKRFRETCEAFAANPAFKQTINELTLSPEKMREFVLNPAMVTKLAADTLVGVYSDKQKTAEVQNPAMQKASEKAPAPKAPAAG